MSENIGKCINCYNFSLLFSKAWNMKKDDEYIHDYAQRIWNVDETGFCLGATSKKVLVKRGAHAVHEVGGAFDHQFITVTFCGNAAGVRLPPFVLYKGKNLYTTWTQGGPAGVCYSVSKSGWMEEANFQYWFEKQFFPSVRHLTATGPVVMFYEGHYPHLGIPLILKARSFGIHLFCLPPNTTHVLQPLDVRVFGPLKASWRKILKAYRLRTRAANVTKDRFPKLISELWDCCFTPSQLKAAFKSTGLSPLNPSKHKGSKLQI